MVASEYPITFGYGETSAPYSPTNPHKGVDRIMPVGTQVVVNGAVIGLSGNTGLTTGAHLHIGKFINGQPTDPHGEGFTLPSCSVYDTGYDATNGNYVRLTVNGVIYVYCHLSRINVIKNQALPALTGGRGAGEEKPMPTIATPELVDSLAQGFFGVNNSSTIATNPGLQFYVGQPVENVIATFNNSPQRDNYLKFLQSQSDTILGLKANLSDLETKQSSIDLTTMTVPEATFMMKIAAFFGLGKT